jgi:hypothetical protein
MNATLLCVALLVPGYGEKDIVKRIEGAGGRAGGNHSDVRMAPSTSDADLCDLCELPSLRCLELFDKGMSTLSNLRWLEDLRIKRAGITDEGLRHFEAMANLRNLYLPNCPNVTDEGIARLKKALPNCKIYR